MQALGIGGGRFLVLSQLVGIAGERVRPPRLGIFAEFRQRCLVGVVAPRAEHTKSATGHSLVVSHLADVVLSVRCGGADGIDHALGLAGSVEMHQGHF